MDYRPINIAEKFAKFSEHWSPKIIARMNDYDLKLVKFQGEFGRGDVGSKAHCVSEVRSGSAASR